MRATKTHGIAAAAVVLGVLLAGPALGAGGSDPSRQPPPGAPARHVTTVAPVPQQPPAGAAGVTPTRHFQRVPQQPANLHPQKAGPSTQRSNHERQARLGLHRGYGGAASSPGRKD
jgi:hypothetical protein